MFTERRVISVYLFIQAIACIFWWIGIGLDILPIHWFFTDDLSNQFIVSFLIPDAILIILGSIYCGILVLGQGDSARIGIWSLAAACWYPTLFCIGQSLIHDSAWIGASMMCTMSGLTLAMATIYGAENQQPSYFRDMKLTIWEGFHWTTIQITIFWCVFLWILPKGIEEATVEWELSFVFFQSNIFVGLSTFAAAATLGFSSAWQFIRNGKATPLPTATPQRMVDTGPYRWIRNPMATAGIIQGISVGIMFGNAAVVAYSLLGGLIWHFFVRPIEEKDLQKRFGKEFLDYRQRTGLWLPNLSSIGFRKTIYNH